MFPAMKLGRLPAKRPIGAPSLRAHAIARKRAPERLDRDHLPFSPGLDGNDKVGDCTAAAIANAIRAQAALSGYRVDIATERVLALYEATSGYVPDRPETDRGAYAVDVLGWQAVHGFDAGGQTPYVGLWATLDHDDPNMLRLAIATFGVGYLGVNLAVADQVAGAVWDTDTPASFGDPAPGSWGEHELIGWSYSGTADTDVVQQATWGALQPATWRWLRSRVEEAHALFHPQLLPSGLGGSGVDLQQLRADVANYGVGG